MGGARFYYEGLVSGYGNYWMVPGAGYDRNSGKLAKRSELLYYRAGCYKYCDHGTLQVATIGCNYLVSLYRTGFSASGARCSILCSVYR